MIPAAPAASSVNGRIRISAHGAKVESRISDIATSSSPIPGVPPANAAAASDSTATITNFERISETSSSTRRAAQTRRAGQTIAANASGSISTTT